MYDDGWSRLPKDVRAALFIIAREVVSPYNPLKSVLVILRRYVGAHADLGTAQELLDSLDPEVAALTIAVYLQEHPDA